MNKLLYDLFSGLSGAVGLLGLLMLWIVVSAFLALALIGENPFTILPGWWIPLALLIVGVVLGWIADYTKPPMPEPWIPTLIERADGTAEISKDDYYEARRLDLVNFSEGKQFILGREIRI